jgi:hypothetical protein
MPVAPRRGRTGGLAPRGGGPTRPPLGGTGLRQGPGLLIAAVYRVAAVSGCAVIGRGEAGRPPPPHTRGGLTLKLMMSELVSERQLGFRCAASVPCPHTQASFV